MNPPLPVFANKRAARVIDLSAKGARLELLQRFEPGESALVVIHWRQHEITVEASVLWCELESMLVDSVQDRYIAGLSFTERSAEVEKLINDLESRDAAMLIEDFRNFDRYRLISSLAGSFGEMSPVSLVDISMRGARIVTTQPLGVGVGDHLRFHVDESMGTVDVVGRVMWSAPSNVPRMYNTGLLIQGHDEVMREAINKLSMRGDARMDLDSLRRKFDSMRARLRAGVEHNGSAPNMGADATS
jgi:PilZ domain-containing protein